MPRVTVVMLGARMHYAVPRILAKNELLELLITDGLADRRPLVSNGIQSLAKLTNSKFFLRAASRSAGELDQSLVQCHDWFGLEYACRRRLPRWMQRENPYLWGGRRLFEVTPKHLISKGGAVFGYNTASLEFFEYCKREGKNTILEQTILPKSLELDILEAAGNAWPEWIAGTLERGAGPDIVDREAAEWEMSDLVLAGSQFVSEGLVRLGVNAEKIKMVPYGVELPPSGEIGVQAKCVQRSSSGPEKLRVLFAGEFGLRKGAPVFLDATADLNGAVEVKVAGNIKADPKLLSPFQDFVDFRGRVPRSQMSELYNWADVFVLPSYVEGSATVCYEAAAHGVPMVYTPNCGNPLQEQDCGIMIPAGDSDALVEAIQRYANDRDLLDHHRSELQKKVQYCGLPRYERDLIEAIKPFLKNH